MVRLLIVLLIVLLLLMVVLMVDTVLDLIIDGVVDVDDRSWLIVDTCHSDSSNISSSIDSISSFVVGTFVGCIL